ncbi:uncharacterized protein LOC130981267 [Arachis stenosperma]|uniref:uncharacterized protein LOC130981267 n=1 Tax=Arachis stenosperma TaxID=217475 RepID=UPI0025AC2F02|nr:uncharacterized protein LOC130981267 [Arachis stenosperma]
MEASQNQSANFNSMDPQSIANFLSQISAIQAHVAKNTGNPMQDPASPYFLHPGESPGNHLIPVTLNAHNYNSWSRAMLLALKSKNKLKFIDGSITKPNENDPLFEAWERCNTYIVSWINLSLSPDIAGSVIWNNSASDLWRDLRRRYYQGDKFRVAELQEELFQLKQGDASITAYYTKLKSIWEDLDNFRPVPNCESCDSICSCGLKVMREYRHEDHTTRFLKGLSEQYSVPRSQLMLMDPLPDIDTAFSMLTQQERQFNESQETKIFFNKATPNFNDDRNKGRGKGRGRSNPIGRENEN